MAIVNEFFKKLASNSATLFKNSSVKAKLITAWSQSKITAAPAFKYASTTSKLNWQKFRRNIPKVSPMLNKPGGINPNRRLARLGFAAGLSTSLISSREKFTKSVSFRKNDMPASVRYGTGFISWSKNAGMNANHLSTEGLGLSLSKLRHTSTI